MQALAFDTTCFQWWKFSVWRLNVILKSRCNETRLRLQFFICISAMSNFVFSLYVFLKKKWWFSARHQWKNLVWTVNFVKCPWYTCNVSDLCKRVMTQANTCFYVRYLSTFCLYNTYMNENLEGFKLSFRNTFSNLDMNMLKQMHSLCFTPHFFIVKRSCQPIIGYQHKNWKFHVKIKKKKEAAVTVRIPFKKS